MNTIEIKEYLSDKLAFTDLTDSEIEIMVRGFQFGYNAKKDIRHELMLLIKKNKKRILIIACTILFLLLIVKGCGNSTYTPSGTTITELISDYEARNGVKFTEWRTQQIRQECEGKSYSEWVEIVKKWGETIPSK